MPKKFNQFGFAPILVILILLLGLGVGVYLTQKTQIFKPKADLNLQPETSLTLNTKNNVRSFNENQSFKVKIMARSDIDTARKVLAEVKYDPAFLEVVKISEDNHNQFNNDEVVPAACLLQTDPTYSDAGNKCNQAGLNTVTFRCGGDTQDRVKTLDKCTNNSELYRKAVKTCESSQVCNPTPSPSPSASASAKPSPSAKPTPNPACTFAPGYPSNYFDEGSKCKKAGLNTVTFRCGGDTQDKVKTVDNCVSNSQLYQEALKVCKSSQVCTASTTCRNVTCGQPATVPNGCRVEESLVKVCGADPLPLCKVVCPAPVTGNLNDFVRKWYKNSLDEKSGTIILGAESKEGELRTTEKDPESPVLASVTFRAIKPGTTSITLTNNSALYTSLDNPIGGLKLNSLSSIIITALPSPSLRPSPSIKPSPSPKPTPNIACSFAPGYPSSYTDTGNKCNKAGLNTVTFRCGGDTQDKVKTIDKCVSNAKLYQEALQVCKTSQACQSN